MSYQRFFALLRRVGYDGDLEDVRREMVRGISDGRTDSLRDLSALEYRELCDRLERTLPSRPRIDKMDTERKKWERAVYAVMSSIGVDIRNRSAVRSFLSARTIGCTNLDALDAEEMRGLFLQLKKIESKPKRNNN